MEMLANQLPIVLGKIQAEPVLRFPSWFAAYSIDASNGLTPSTFLIERYSRYKYGDRTEIANFSFDLINLVNRVRGGEINQDWVLFTPPYSSIEPAARPLGDKVAAAFDIPHIDFRTSPDGDRKNQYAAIMDTQDRIRAKFSAKTQMPDAAFVSGKRAVVIDDMVTTGATAAYLEQILKTDYDLREVTTFSVIDLLTPSPKIEEDINRALVTSGNTKELLRILNEQAFPINRHILKTFYTTDRAIFDTIKGQLSLMVLDRIEEAAERYYGGQK